MRKDATDIANAAIKNFAEKDQYRVSLIQSHVHDGVGSQQIPFANIQNRILPIHWTVVGADAATAANYGVFWTAPFPCTVVGMTEVHQTAGTAVGSVTLQLERLQGTEAPDAGDNILATAFNLKANANTVQNGVITPTRTSGISPANLSKGDRLCLKDSGTLTSLSNVTVVVLVQY